jgi:hypothetical protein
MFISYILYEPIMFPAGFNNTYRLFNFIKIAQDSKLCFMPLGATISIYNNANLKLSLIV